MNLTLLRQLQKAVARRFFCAVHLLFEIEATERAAAFGYYALFSLFPLIALLLTLGSIFFPAESVTHFIENVAPLEESQKGLIWQTVDTLEKTRGSVGIISFCILLWTSMRFFKVLVVGVNRAWHTTPNPWWKVPVKNLTMLGTILFAVALGVLLPIALEGIFGAIATFEGFLQQQFPDLEISPYLRLVNWSRWGVGTVVLFFCFAVLYKLAPARRVSLRTVLLPAFITAICFQVLQEIFINILPHIVNYNRVYGTVGGLMFLLMWIYASGLVILFGACLCASKEEKSTSTPSS
ncbi:MAG: YihY/virulence factor BrkB family protein [Chthoniobacterales bacterium]